MKIIGSQMSIGMARTLFSREEREPANGPGRRAFQQQANTGVAVLKPRPAMPSSHPSRRVDAVERA
jgi:hypothetical protein